MLPNTAPRTTNLEALLPPATATNSMRLIQARWLAGVLVIAATAICTHLLHLPLPEAPLYALGAFILSYNVWLLWLTQNSYRPGAKSSLQRLQRLVVLQIALDWLSMTVFLNLTGGITSPGVLFFVLHILVVTILLPGQSPYRFTALAVGLVTALALLEAEGVLAHHAVIPGLPPALHQNVIYVLAQVIFFAIAMFAVVYLTASIMNRLREHERQITALFHTTQAVSSTLDLTDVLQGLARSAAQAMTLPGVSIRLLDDNGDQLRVAAMYGLSEAYMKKGPVELSINPLARDALLNGPVIVAEATNDPRIQYPHKVREEGIHSMLVVPMLGRSKPLGILRFYHYLPDHFTPKDIPFAVAIAQQGATAIENAMAHDTLQKANEERAQFVRIVTHELRAPVAGAQSLLRVLLRNLAGEISDQQRDILTRLEERMDALMTLINDLLSFAAGRTVDAHQPLEVVPLQEALHTALDRVKTQAEEKQIALDTTISEQPLRVAATSVGLTRIFDNLIGNAVKYTPEGGRVCVEAHTEADSVVIRVQDTGIGIPQDALNTIGQEFFRAPNAKESGIIGTGLGLAIVRQHVTQFGGLMSVQSEVGVGSTFTITLPLAEKPPNPTPV